MSYDRRRRFLVITISFVASAAALSAMRWLSPDPAASQDAVAHEQRRSDSAKPNDKSHLNGGKPRSNADNPNRHVSEGKSFTLKGEGFHAKVSSLGASISSVQLDGGRFRDEQGKSLDVVTTDREAFLPLSLELKGVSLPSDAEWLLREKDGQRRVVLEWQDDNLKVVRAIEVGSGPYQLWSTVRIVNKSNKSRRIGVSESTHHYVLKESEEGGFFLAASSPQLSHGVCDVAGEMEREDSDDLEQPRSLGESVRFAGVENVYFANVLAPHGRTAQRCVLSASPRGGTIEDPLGTLYSAALKYPEQTLPAGQSSTFKTLAYLGPKDFKSLREAGHGLPKVVDLGFFAVIAKYLTRLLSVIEGYVGNWGLAIILLTVLVKLLLYPLTEKSFKSMARMRLLKPELDKLNELYADDREKKGAAMMELYRKHKINPLGGCLPSLLQLPIWFSLYTSLSTNVELYHAPFAFWLVDLSSPDPFFVLPLSLGLLMFLQQKITPTTMDPAQAKMMLYFMPVMITTFMLFLPAGLCLYMVTNSTLGMGQQWLIQQRLESGPAASGSGAKAPVGSAPVDEKGSKKSNPPKNDQKMTKRLSQGGRLEQRRHRRGRA